MQWAHQCVLYSDCRELVSQALNQCETLAVLSIDEQWAWVQSNIDIFGDPYRTPSPQHRRIPSVWTSRRAKETYKGACSFTCGAVQCLWQDTGDDFASCDACGRWTHLNCAHVTAKNCVIRNGVALNARLPKQYLVHAAVVKGMHL